MSNAILFCPDELSDQEEVGFPDLFASQVAQITALERQLKEAEIAAQTHQDLVSSQIAESLRLEVQEVLANNPLMK